MTFTIVSPTKTGADYRPQTQAVPRKGKNYDYGFLRDMPNGAMAAIHVDIDCRSISNVRRSVQYAKPGAKTMTLDNVLMVW